MNRLTLIAVCAALAGCQTTAPTYRSIPDAIEGLRMACRPIPAGLECAGVVMRKSNGAYVLSKTVIGSRESYSMHVDLAADEQLAALFHTHPEPYRPTDGKFSPDDIATQQRLGVPSYVLTFGNTLMVRSGPGPAVGQ